MNTVYGRMTVESLHAHAGRTMFGLAERPERYAKLLRGPFRRVHARLVADVVAAGLPDGARVLDVGTGPGGVPIAIAEATALRVDGLDLAATMIDHARAVATRSAAGDRVTFTVGDVEALPYPDGSFDLVVSSMSQHHWGNVPGGMREIRRVLRPGGRAWIYDARIALGRASAAAERAGADAGGATGREPVRTGRLPIRLVGRVWLSAPA
jgi:SAM-dependent methyltransferase